jgi:hypothetical protein
MTALRLAPLALVAVLAVSCGDKNKSSSPATPPSTTTTATTTTTTTSATSTVSTGPSGTTPRPAQPPSKANRLLLGKRDLYPLLAGSIARYVPNQVRGKSVSVVQVEGADIFWAGRNKKQRILVKLNLKGKGKGSPRLTQGGQVDFVGHLAKAPANDANAPGLGVKDKTGASTLQNQGAYVIVSAGDLKLH